MELGKYKLSALVVVTSGAGFVSAGALDCNIFTACIGTALCAAAAGTFNQVLERDRDARMRRTRVRPLPSGRISPSEAITFGLLSATSGVSLLYTLNPISASLGMANILLYAGPYTLSKPYTESNTWIGAIVGAVPPIIGWTAASGGNITAMDPIALATLLYLWQFPHFFALSWLHREDYARGEFAMVAVNDPGGIRSADLILRYSCYLCLLPCAAAGWGITSYMFCIEGSLLNAYMVLLSWRFSREQTNGNARAVFLYTLVYLPLLLAGFLWHNHNWDKIEDTAFMRRMTEVRDQLRRVCLHELLVERNKEENVMLCPKVRVDVGTEVITEAAALVTDAGADAEVGVGVRKR